ncbi:DNA-entry nuclease [Paenibacillus polymyxa]|uniref:DNA-entry nuclease n=1 Tax=Paenibacillus polymyxa TaxID=1406 RepID=UPI0010BE539A|nr:DNA-entry nuclease [Paenibacillus polymyxa]TKH40310.1 DNA-entry nuclease [Paenibacillus polymyxa]
MNINFDDGITYDKLGRMQYHPDFHPNHHKPFSREELIYLCKYWGVDDRRTMSYALGRTECTLSSKVTNLKKSGKFNYYKSLEE